MNQTPKLDKKSTLSKLLEKRTANPKKDSNTSQTTRTTFYKTQRDPNRNTELVGKTPDKNSKSFGVLAKGYVKVRQVADTSKVVNSHRSFLQQKTVVTARNIPDRSISRGNTATGVLSNTEGKLLRTKLKVQNRFDVNKKKSPMKVNNEDNYVSHKSFDQNVGRNTRLTPPVKQNTPEVDKVDVEPSNIHVRKPSNRYEKPSQQRVSNTQNPNTVVSNNEESDSIMPVSDHRPKRDNITMESFHFNVQLSKPEHLEHMPGVMEGQTSRKSLKVIPDHGHSKPVYQAKLGYKDKPANLKALKSNVTAPDDMVLHRPKYSDDEPSIKKTPFMKHKQANVSTIINSDIKKSVSKKSISPINIRNKIGTSSSVDKFKHSHNNVKDELAQLLANNRSLSRSVALKPSKTPVTAIKNRLKIKSVSKEAYKGFIYEKIKGDENFSVIDILINRTHDRRISYPKLYGYLSDLYKQILLTNLIIKNSRKENPIDKIEKVVLDTPVRDKLKLKTIMIDLDETLIHAEPAQPDASYDHTFELTRGKIGLRLRPYIFDFLEQIYQRFELVLYTASGEVYAMKIKQLIDPDGKYFAAILHRQHCVFFKSAHLKSIDAIANRDRNDIFVIDNSLYAFPFDHAHKILIRPYTDDVNDCELLKVLVFIRENLMDASKVLPGVISSIISCQDLLECMHINDLVGLFKKHIC